MLLKKLWNDEAGLQVSLETVMVATLGTLAVTGGIASVASSVNSELGDLSAAVLSFDQSYSTSGYSVNGSVQGGSSTGTGSKSSGFGFSGYKAPSGFRQQSSGGVNFGGAAPQQFQQQSFNAPNVSATILVDDIAGDADTDADNFTTIQPSFRAQPQSNQRTQPQASRQPARLREQVVIEEALDEDTGDGEFQTIVVPRNRRSNRAGEY